MLGDNVLVCCSGGFEAPRTVLPQPPRQLGEQKCATMLDALVLFLS